MACAPARAVLLWFWHQPPKINEPPTHPPSPRQTVPHHLDPPPHSPLPVKKKRKGSDDDDDDDCMGRPPGAGAAPGGAWDWDGWGRAAALRALAPVVAADLRALFGGAAGAERLAGLALDIVSATPPFATLPFPPTPLPRPASLPLLPPLALAPGPLLPLTAAASAGGGKFRLHR